MKKTILKIIPLFIIKTVLLDETNIYSTIVFEILLNYQAITEEDYFRTVKY